MFSTYLETILRLHNYNITSDIISFFGGGKQFPHRIHFPQPCSAMERSRSRATAPAALPRPEAEEESEEDVTGLVQMENHDGNVYR